MSQAFKPLTPSSRSLSEISPSEGDSAEVRLRKAILLKDHAISKGITISEPILDLLNLAECEKDRRKYLCENGSKIDQALGELTHFTYPTTGDTLLALANPDQAERIERFKRQLPWWLLVAGAGFAVGQILLRSNPPYRSGDLVLAASLGLLGSVMFQIFNTIGILKEKAFSLEDVYSNQLRIFLGPVIGLLFYFALAQGALAEGEKLSNGFRVFLPFLAGFSTKLVIGILDKMIQAVMLAFGIEDKRADVLVRQRRHQSTAGKVPPGPDEDPGSDDNKDAADDNASEGAGNSEEVSQSEGEVESELAGDGEGEKEGEDNGVKGQPGAEGESNRSG